jgi:hypothetical protein
MLVKVTVFAFIGVGGSGTGGGLGVIFPEGVFYRATYFICSGSGGISGGSSVGTGAGKFLSKPCCF